MTYAGLLQIEFALDPAPRLVGDPDLFVSACDRVALNLNQLRLETAPRSGTQIESVGSAIATRVRRSE